jgi:hypothetical protein
MIEGKTKLPKFRNSKALTTFKLEEDSGKKIWGAIVRGAIVLLHCYSALYIP